MIIDVIETINGGGPEFTVDLSVRSVSVTLGAPEPLWNAVPNRRFQKADNLQALSMGWSLPYCFSPAEKHAKIELEWDGPGGTYPIRELDGQTGSFQLPLPDEEIVVGVYIPYPLSDGDADTTKQIQLISFDADVSMVNVPDSFDGDTLRCKFWVKALHNLPLLA